MKTQKITAVIIELDSKETKILSEALFKILAVEKANTPHVISSLNSEETNLIDKLYKNIKDDF